jgi:hypothetical protein
LLALRRWRVNQPVVLDLLSGVPSSINCIASKWLRVSLVNPAAWTIASFWSW